MNKFLIVVLIGFLLVGSVSAIVVDFYYNPECPHCKQVAPLVSELSKQHKINFLDTSKGSYDIQGVPTIKIKTDDGREIELVGSQEIPRWLRCELNEMTTKGCPTYSSNNCIGGSWFIR